MDRQAPVAVVGAGIGGLALAGGLARAGIPCAVLERAPALTPAGGGLQVAPNASRLLHGLGLAPVLRESAARPAVREFRRGDDDSLLAVTALGDACERAYGGPYYTLLRSDLHRALLSAVAPGAVHLGQQVVAVEERDDAVAAVLATGARLPAAVVVGADGVHSRVRTAVTGDAPPVAAPADGPTGEESVVYRGLVPTRDLPSALRAPAVRVWTGPDGWGRGQHCVAYPVAAGRAVSVAATAAGALRAAYAGWSPTVRRLLDSAEVLGCWPLRDRPPLARWSSRRVTLLGDAAHPMLPFLAQGANQAVEDAATLAVCLAEGAGGDVATALRRYEELRRPRTAAVQRASRAPGSVRDVGWLYGYDADLVAREATARTGHRTCPLPVG